MSDRRSERRSPKGELTTFEKNGFDSAQAESDARTKAYHERGRNTDWKKMELRIQSGDYSPAKGELTSYETARKITAEAEPVRKIKADAETERKIKAEAETTLLQQNKELQDKYDKAMERNKYYDDRINKHSEEDKKLRTLIAELRAHIAKYCPKKKFKTVGGQKQKNKSKKPKSNKTKKRKYKRSKHRHTKKPN